MIPLVDGYIDFMSSHELGWIIADTHRKLIIDRNIRRNYQRTRNVIACTSERFCAHWKRYMTRRMAVSNSNVAREAKTFGNRLELSAGRRSFTRSVNERARSATYSCLFVRQDLKSLELGELLRHVQYATFLSNDRYCK